MIRHDELGLILHLRRFSSSGERVSLFSAAAAVIWRNQAAAPVDHQTYNFWNFQSRKSDFLGLPKQLYFTLKRDTSRISQQSCQAAEVKQSVTYQHLQTEEFFLDEIFSPTLWHLSLLLYCSGFGFWRVFTTIDNSASRRDDAQFTEQSLTRVSH